MIGPTGAGNIDVSGEADFHVAMSVMHAPDDAVSLHFLFAFILYFIPTCKLFSFKRLVVMRVCLVQHVWAQGSMKSNGRAAERCADFAQTGVSLQ